VRERTAQLSENRSFAHIARAIPRPDRVRAAFGARGVVPFSRPYPLSRQLGASEIAVLAGEVKADEAKDRQSARG